MGDALKVIEKRGSLHQALKDGFIKLYGYTSDEGGIRHAMLNEPNLASSDALYFLLSCTSFVNYLKGQLKGLAIVEGWPQPPNIAWSWFAVSVLDESN